MNGHAGEFVPTGSAVGCAGRQLGRRGLMSVAGLLVVAGGVIGFRSPVRAESMIEIDATATSTPVHWLEDATFSLVVTNSGTEPFTDVVATAYVEGATLDPIEDAVTGPVAPAGNGDDVLDVGEQWIYEAIAPASTLEFDVSAKAADASTVTASQGFGFGNFPEALQPPIDVSAVVDRSAVVAGEQVRWTIVVSNLIDSDLVWADGYGEHRVLYPDWVGPVGFTPLGMPVDQGDGDEVLAPGESWQWYVEHVIEVDGSYLEGWFGMGLAGFVERYGFPWRSDGLSAELPPSTTTPPAATGPVTEPLPSTGLDATMAALAVVFMSAGAVMVIATRIRFRPERG